MPLKSTFITAAVLLLLTVQIHAYYLVPVVDQDIDFGPTEHDYSLANFRHSVPMFKKRNGGHKSSDELDESKIRKTSSVSGHMLKQPFLKFDFLRRNFLSQKL
ncbi:hypothetical protein M3Y97_00794100 [Aphelenchoides bicaudatus]|nr:hypothetical protein M3Y97_00794100 [Aphelenchoides bicaudatus]